MEAAEDDDDAQNYDAGSANHNAEASRDEAGSDGQETEAKEGGTEAGGDASSAGVGLGAQVDTSKLQQRSKAKWRCKTCKVALCVGCWDHFHNDQVLLPWHAYAKAGNQVANE